MKNLIKILLSFFLLFISINCFSQSYFLHKIEGDKQLGIRGIELKKDFILKLTDSNDIPVENAEISLHIVENVTDERNSSFLTTPYIRKALPSFLFMFVVSRTATFSSSKSLVMTLDR